MKKLKRGISALLLFVMVSALGLTGCGGESTEPDEVNKITEIEAVDYDASFNAYPKPEGETQRTINYIELAKQEPYTDTILALALQGIANRENPSMYLIHPYMIQTTGLYSSQYWFEQLDSTYTNEDGSPYFEKVKFDSLYELVAEYRDLLGGAVLYDSAIVTGTVCDPNSNNYGYMAVLNLLTMMCGQYDALPLTEGELTELNAWLTEQGLEPLEVKGSTLDFDLTQDNRALWKEATLYALERAESGEWTFSDKAIAHDGTFNGAYWDYVISHKIFHYTRIFSTLQTEEEAAIEDRIMALTGDDTVVIGVWHLVGDENSLVTYVNEHGKFFEVTHETWNLTWTSGLPSETLEEQSEELVYDESKVYIAMSLSEGDNNSYTNYKLPITWDLVHDSYSNVVMTYPVCETAFDLNPNIIRWMNANATATDGFVVAESGIGYLNPNLTDLESSWDLAGFYGMTDSYLDKMISTSAGKRTYRNDMVPNLKEVVYLDNMDYLVSGYGAVSGYSTEEYFSGKNNIYFRGTPVMQAIGVSKSPDFLTNSVIEDGSILYIGMSGWEVDISSISRIVDSCPDNYVFVTTAQLADLYEQKVAAKFTDVTFAEFDCDMTEDEAGFLWYSDDFGNYYSATIEGERSYRLGRRENYAIYKFDFRDDVTAARFVMEMSGEYDISVSTDYENWYSIGRYDIARDDTTYNQIREITCQVPAHLLEQSTEIYLKIADPTPNDGVGYRAYAVSAVTDKASVDQVMGVDGLYDGAYYVSGGEKTESGYRTGAVVYQFPFDASVTEALLTVEATEAATLEFSADGRTWYPLAVQTYDRSGFSVGSLYTAYLDSILNNLYIRVTTGGEIRYVNVTPIGTTGGFTFAPTGHVFEQRHLTAGWDATRTTSGTSPRAAISNATVLSYAFRLDASLTDPVLELYAAGMFKLEISTDGSNWITLKEVAAGENITSSMSFNISAYVKAGSLCYVRLTKSVQTGGNAMLYWMKLHNAS